MDKKKKLAIIIASGVVGLAVIVGAVLLVMKNKASSDELQNETTSSESLPEDEINNDDSDVKEEAEEAEEQQKNSDEESIEFDDIDLYEDTSVEMKVDDKGNVVVVTFTDTELSPDETSTAVETFEFENNVLKSVHVECILPNAEAADELYKELQELKDYFSNLSKSGNKISYDMNDLSEFDGLTKEQLTEYLSQMGGDVS